MLRIKWRTTENAIQGSFTAIFERACDCILRADPDPDEIDIFLFYSHPAIRDRVQFSLTYDPWSKGRQGEFVK